MLAKNFSTGLAKGLLAWKALQKGFVKMSLMKPPLRKRKKGAGNSAPKKRTAFPDVSQPRLDEHLHEYCRGMGVKESFNLYEYLKLEKQQAENPRAMVKLERLLATLLLVSPSGQIKYSSLKQSFQVLLQSWGEELLKPHWPNMPAVSQLAGRAADAAGILLNHWRRVTHSQTAWEKFISRLDVSQEAAMGRLRKQMQGGPTTKKRALKPKVSDVSMDSLGFPKMTAMEVEKGDEDEEDEEDVASGGEESSSKSCDQAAMGSSPPPVLKKDWKEHACKKPAAADTLMKKPSSTSLSTTKVGAGLAKGLSTKGTVKVLGKGLKVDLSTVLIHQDTISQGGGKNQAYLQHMPGPGKNKRLIVAITKNQASKTSKTHKQLVEMLLTACKKPGASKADVHAERDKILAKYAK